MNRETIELIVGSALTFQALNHGETLKHTKEFVDHVAGAIQKNLEVEALEKDQTVVVTSATEQEEGPQAIVLCVRVRPIDIPPPTIKAFQEAFPNHLIHFHFVNPRTPEELDKFTESPGVVAVYLQERPLPTIVMENGRIPCVLMRSNGHLARLTGIIPQFEPFPIA